LSKSGKFIIADSRDDKLIILNPENLEAIATSRVLPEEIV